MGNKLLIVVNHADFFISHRLPIAIEALKSGLEVHVATMSTPVVNELKKYGIKWHELPLEPGGMNPFKDFKLMLNLYSVYKLIKPDIVHHVTIKPVLYGSIVARISRTPAVVNALSGLGYIFINDRIKEVFIRKILIILFKYGFGHFNTTLILQNPDDKNEFIRRGIIEGKKIEIIKGSGVDPQKFKPYLGLPDESVRILFASRMLKDKGLEEFINASKIINERGYSADFLLVGNPDKNNPQSVSEEQLKAWDELDFISWFGFRSDMEHVFREADIVCLPSYREGLPKVLIEAASCGKPIVTTDVPGCREIVKNGLNGFLVPPKDSKSLANAIIKLIDNPVLRKQMGKKGREMVLKEFTLEKVINDTLNIYQELLEKDYKP